MDHTSIHHLVEFHKTYAMAATVTMPAKYVCMEDCCRDVWLEGVEHSCRTWPVITWVFSELGSEEGISPTIYIHIHNTLEATS